MYGYSALGLRFSQLNLQLNKPNQNSAMLRGLIYTARLAASKQTNKQEDNNTGIWGFLN